MGRVVHTLECCDYRELGRGVSIMHPETWLLISNALTIKQYSLSGAESRIYKFCLIIVVGFNSCVILLLVNILESEGR